jgi:hypothetical protein
MALNSGYAFLSAPKAVLRAAGDDVFSFLQGQFTNQLRQQAGAMAYGLWLNQKGRVLADSIVLCVSENEFLVISWETPAETILQRLQHYIVADDVTLTDETTGMAGVVVGGKDCAKVVEGLLGGLAPAGRFVRLGEVLLFGGHGALAESYYAIGPVGLTPGWEQYFRANECRLITLNDFDRIRISAGAPVVPRDLGPGDLPNEGGLEETAISYTKGCYLGQEVMARLKNLGQVRRRLRVVRGSGEPPRSQDPLYQGQKKVGELRSVAEDGKGFVAFAMLSLVPFDPAAALSLKPDGDPTVRLDQPHG